MSMQPGSIDADGLARTSDGKLYVTAVGNAAITGGSIAGVTGVATIIANSGTAVACGADTTEDTLATITIPAGRLRANDAFHVRAVFTYTNSVGTKTPRVRWSGASGTVIAGGTARTTTLGSEYEVTIWNANATNAQQQGLSREYTTTGLAAFATVPTLAVDTTAATTIVITGQKNTSGDALTLVGYTVTVIAA